MANFIFKQDSYFTDFVAECATEDSSYPAVNVENYLRPHKHFRSEDDSAPDLIFDFGSNVTIPGLVMNGLNFTGAKFYKSTDKAAWTETDDKTISQEDITGDYRLYVPLTGFTTQRYLKVVPSSLISGETYYKVESALALSNIAALSRNPQSEYDIEPEYGGDEINYSSGRWEYIGFSRRWQYHAEFEFVDCFSNLGNYQGTFSRSAKIGAYVLYENGYEGGGTEKVFVIKIVGGPKFKNRPGHFKTGSLELLEII